jgi:hypothetical protein
MARTDLVVLKAFELSYHPGQYRLIDVSEHGVQRRWGISPVVLDPAPEEWIELPAQSRLAATSEPLFRRSDPLRHQSRWFPSQRTPAGEQAPANVRLVRKRSSVTPLWSRNSSSRPRKGSLPDRRLMPLPAHSTSADHPVVPCDAQFRYPRSPLDSAMGTGAGSACPGDSAPRDNVPRIVAAVCLAAEARLPRFTLTLKPL